MFGSKKVRFVSYFLSWLPIFYYWANLYRMFNYSELPYIYLSVLVGFIGMYKLFTDQKLNSSFLIIVFFLYGLTGIFNYGFIGNVELNDVLSSLFVYGIFIVMIAYPIDYLQAIVSFAVTILFFLNAYYSGAATYLMLTSSGNYVSVLLILGLCVYFIGVNNSNKKLSLFDIIPAILCFWLAIWARGRGGILSTGLFLLLLVMAIIKQSQEERSKLYKIVFFTIPLLVIIMLLKSINIIEEFFSLGKFGDQEFDTPRPLMWAEYLKKMFESPLYVLLGSPLNEVSSMHIRGNNAHNSFIQLHAYNGIIIFLGFIVLLYKSIVYMYKKHLYALLIITFIIVIRGMTDKFIFGQYGMPVMLYLAFYPFAYKKVTWGKRKDGYA